MHVVQEYYPKPNSRTVYFLNHNYWWDGLLPLYLNEKYFNQKARALMEDTQMRQYRFFSRIGAFSIDLNNPKSSILSLRYALESMKRDNASLYIYPEGKIVTVSEKTSELKQGLAWVYQNTEDIDFVPIGLFIDHSKQSKPDFNIYIGNSVNYDKQLHRSELTDLFERDLNIALTKSRKLNHQVHS